MKARFVFFLFRAVVSWCDRLILNFPMEFQTWCRIQSWNTSERATSFSKNRFSAYTTFLNITVILYITIIYGKMQDDLGIEVILMIYERHSRALRCVLKRRKRTCSLNSSRLSDAYIYIYIYTYISKPSNYCFEDWLWILPPPVHYLNKYWLIENWLGNRFQRIKYNHFLSTKGVSNVGLSRVPQTPVSLLGRSSFMHYT